ncbi:TlpA family protein disulfide reductase [Pedobacter rhodius]|uniref:TlpA disulfide reductase family protein n=1 Tax=Pedobacter rhodius TaxID=3004098 RepID=A0ABT4KZV8_9SPHI|nr:TlpA disulfide reductase family protein [Pedobacter sp. SJ11]MCZ4224452.1 TlpA disulfide reductase family protein [Pedobacter sp. SJ11]
MKKSLTFLLLLLSTVVFAQESNNGKKLWAKSILNEKAPELVVEKWISKQPDTRGKFVLIDFWATWCGPCRAYIPTLNDVQAKYADKIVIIGVSDESAEKVEAFNNPKINYFEAIDTKGTVKNSIQVKGIPHAILIDPNGIVRWEGFPLLDGAQLTEEIVKALLEKYKI